ncbi:MAG: hypothetical protein PHT84_02080 [Candidatus Pacebacteria bacterium]|nr:hypothetical protein [Candidatus Paceibacterota bacterium]
MKRGFFDIALFLALFILPWWVSVFLALVGIFLFKNFYEFIITGFVIYSIYIIPGSGIITSPFIFPLVIIILYFIIQTIRKQIILYNNNDISY